MALVATEAIWLLFLALPLALPVAVYSFFPERNALSDGGISFLVGRDGVLLEGNRFLSWGSIQSVLVDGVDIVLRGLPMGEMTLVRPNELNSTLRLMRHLHTAYKEALGEPIVKSNRGTDYRNDDRREIMLAAQHPALAREQAALLLKRSAHDPALLEQVREALDDFVNPLFRRLEGREKGS